MHPNAFILHIQHLKSLQTKLEKIKSNGNGLTDQQVVFDQWLKGNHSRYFLSLSLPRLLCRWFDSGKSMSCASSLGCLINTPPAVLVEYPVFSTLTTRRAHHRREEGCRSWFHVHKSYVTHSWFVRTLLICWREQFWVQPLTIKVNIVTQLSWAAPEGGGGTHKGYSHFLDRSLIKDWRENFLKLLKGAVLGRSLMIGWRKNPETLKGCPQ